MRAEGSEEGARCPSAFVLFVILSGKKKGIKKGD